jgi:SAM-dependent methyltransferase
MSKPEILRGYRDDAPSLIPRFEALRTLDVLAPAAALLPKVPSRILDVGAGTGRDAAWLVANGHQVVAVEPVDELREAGMRLHPSERIRWVKDELPSLDSLENDAAGYDLVLVVGVWQHLMPEEHAQAVGVLADKVAPRGRLIMSLRQGPGAASRLCYPADPTAIVAYAKNAGLRLEMRCETRSLQQENRDQGVTWTWVSLDRL